MCMSFFTGSSGLTITGGNFTSISLPTDAAGAAQVLGKIKERDSCEFEDYARADGLRKRHWCRSLDGLMIVKAEEVDLHRELTRGISYRIHSASHRGRFVAVKAFEGPRAKQDWTVDVACSKEFLHPNVLKIVGVSDERSKKHFVLFHGITSEQKMQSLIAKALRTDLNTSVRLSMKAVKGIAAGLSYIKSQNIPMYPGATNHNRKWENFDIFTGYDNEPIISFDPSNTVHELENCSASQTFDKEIDGRGIEVLTGLCQQLFSGANSILYDDSPEREFDVHDRESFPRPTLEDPKGTSNVSESEDMSNPSNSTEKQKSHRTPRREVWWLDLDAKDQSLESIKRHFEDCLDRFLLSSSNSLLRHITSPMDNKLRRNLHQCPGYLREEITLTSDVSKSAIISHAFPSQSEVCSICGQLVQYKCTDEPSIVDGEKQEANSPNGSHDLSWLPPSGFLSPDSPSDFPIHSHQVLPSGLLSPQSPKCNPPSPVLSDLSDSSSIWSPPSPTLSTHSRRRFMTTLQLRDNRPEEKSGLSSLGLLNPDTFTRHRRKSLDSDTDSNLSLWSPPFPTLSNRSVHFVPDTPQLRDNKPEEKSEFSSERRRFNPDRSRHHRKLSDIDSEPRFTTAPQLRNNRPEKKSGRSSLGRLNLDTSTRHRQKPLDSDTESNFSVGTPPFPTLSNRSVHFLPDTHQSRDNKPEEKSGFSSQQSLFNPDSSFRHHRRKLSDIDSGSAGGWVPRSPTLSSHSGRSGPSHTNKQPEENAFRFHRGKGGSSTSAITPASSNSVVTRAGDLNDDSYSHTHTTIPDDSPGGGRRPLSGFFSSFATMLSRKSSGRRRGRSGHRF